MSDALLRHFLAQAKDHALILLDQNGRVAAWLMGAAQLFGYESEEMLGQPIDRLFTPEDRARRVPHGEIEIAVKYGRAEDDRWLLRKDGVRLWVSGVMTCLHDPEGRVVGFSKLLRDRTDVKEQIDALRSRGAALEAAEQQKTVLLGTLAHELRNPLGVLTHAVQLIERAYPEDRKLAPAIQLLGRQVKYLSTLIEDLLEDVRLQAGKVALQAERTDLHGLLSSAVETASVSIGQKRQKVELLLPQTPILLQADPIRLKQVFVNLLSNASKFSGDEDTIWVKAVTEGDEAVVRLEDQGRGIPSELLPNLFEMFSQGEPANGQSHPSLGVGLGLSIVKQYVELHGGSVQARSEGSGRGSEFIVRLPLARE
ncbi:MAG: PAS domain-containing sensor histidine kinase [Burkholderiales bacterium]